MKLPLILILFSVSSGLMMVNQTTNDMSIQDPQRLTVMSYNIRYDTPDDGINAWPNRKEYVAEMMGDRYGADIIGVQEALKHQIDELQAMLPGYSWVGVGRSDGWREGEFSPIFYNSDRLDLVATNTFWLSESPHQPGSKSWDAAITRVATWAKFADLETGREFYVLNTHFDHMGEQARVESSKIISEFVSNLWEALPVIVTGDFNVPESSDAYTILAESEGLDDARYESESGHEGPTASFSNWEELQPDESRIDYIFVSKGIRVLNHAMLDDRFDGRFPSDHLPVHAELLLGE
ncbi:MAG: endonuclease/exonuclease/phosphatase [Bacteroidetes bacterium]|jgi:endonuclease/exonuclease/phosphatase family metal-dependent hydrolase|nr:endonuclease/exonuclease/phosphatase [Bacteroidota bacterium]